MALVVGGIVPDRDKTLLQDFFGELLYQYAVMYPELPPCAFPLDPDGVNSVADLRAGVALMREEWARTATDVLWRRSRLGLSVSAADASTLDLWMARARQPVAAPAA